MSPKKLIFWPGIDGYHGARPRQRFTEKEKITCSTRFLTGSVVRLEVDDASKNDQAALFGGWPNGYDDWKRMWIRLLVRPMTTMTPHNSIHKEMNQIKATANSSPHFWQPRLKIKMSFDYEWKVCIFKIATIIIVIVWYTCERTTLEKYAFCADCILNSDFQSVNLEFCGKKNIVRIKGPLIKATTQHFDCHQ